MAGDIFTAHPLRDFRQDAESRGNRARFQRFAQEQLSKYARVLHVMGNHEHYRETFQDTAGLLRDFFKTYAPNTRLLDNETEIILLGDEQIAVLGTTFWAPCCVGHPLDEHRIVNAMADFRVIRWREGDEQRTYRPRDAFNEHMKARYWLEEEVTKHKRAIILSHHAPSLQSANGVAHNTTWMDSAYCSDQVDFIMARPQIELWAHGHTHRDEDYQIGTTRVIANQHGYPHERNWQRPFDVMAVDFELKETANENPSS